MDLRRKLSAGEIVAVSVVLAVVAMVARNGLRHRVYPGSTCQSNLQQIGKAIKVYLTDWHDTFPTNRRWVSRGKLGPVTDQVKLTPAGADKEGNPLRFRYGVTWVEGLYSYTEAVTMQADQSSAWRCPSASERAYPANSRTVAVTYAFNRNLIEKSETLVKGPGNLMMVREMDRCVESVLRPTNGSNGKPSAPPVSPFLNRRDARLGRTNSDVHGKGSNVLFADGHVKLYELDYFPPQSHYTGKHCWDAETKQWYNYGPSADAPDGFIKSIAITL